MKRRKFLSRGVTAVAVGSAAGVGGASFAMLAQPPTEPPGKPDHADGAIVLKGRIKQSVCRWCFGSMKLDDLCREAAAMGIRSVELLNPDEWDAPKKHGITCALASFVRSNPISQGLNRQEHHDAIIRDLEERLPRVKEAGIPSQIVFSGNRAGMSDEDGLKNCVIGLKRITPLAEKLGVTIVMELLNSKVDHKDYMCDRTPWGVELVKRVGSPRFKLLYDIYHMQIMEGDVIRTITDHIDAIGHFHTAGVPGRRDLDEKQELNYRAICEAIVARGFDGYLAQEFMPKGEPMEALRKAVAVCDV